ncbi:MAG TPA: GGDEF domain-containing protein [Steroidobacteraceae bacterium]|nr:GGDEF domain-containing protein [Steroidobacteraceae bacterium]
MIAPPATADVLQASVLAWAHRVLAARSLATLADELAAPPAAPAERLVGQLVLADPRHELRLLTVGENDAAPATEGLRFVDGLAGIAPALTALHAPSAGRYHAADHALLFGEQSGLTHVLLLPLPQVQTLTGVYAIGAFGASPALTGLATPWLEHVAALALAGAERLVQRARLLRAGVVDPLTGWNSRHYVQARMREQVAASQRRKEPATCLVVDVDGLGALNETHGVAAGDAALLEAGTRIEAQVRASDAFGHLGEDEFAVVLPATTAAAAVVLAERILAAMRAAPARIGSSVFPLRVSIGIAELDVARPGIGHERKAVGDQWLADALAALHHAKRAGGDGYEFSSAAAASARGI